MIYETRVYRCLPGRLPALLNRFENVTLKLWEKHGIKQAGFFTTLIGETNQELTYFLAWDLSPIATRSGPGSWATRNGSQRAPKPRRRPHRRQGRQPDAGADLVFVGEVTLSALPHAPRPHRPRRPRPRRGGGILSPRRFHGRRAQPASVGDAQSHRAAPRRLHRAAAGRRTRAYPAACARCPVRRLSPRFSRRERGLRCWSWKETMSGTPMRSRHRHRRFRGDYLRARGQAADGTASRRRSRWRSPPIQR